MRNGEDGELAIRMTGGGRQPPPDEENPRDPLLVEIGQKLLKARQAAGLRQAELAEKAGTTHSTVFMAENGRQNLSIRMLQALANALGLQARDLLPGEDPRVAASPEGLQRVADTMIGALGRVTLLAEQLEGTAKLLSAVPPSEGRKD